MGAWGSEVVLFVDGRDGWTLIHFTPLEAAQVGVALQNISEECGCLSAADLHKKLLAKTFLATRYGGGRELVVDMRDVADLLFPGTTYPRDDDSR